MKCNSQDFSFSLTCNKILYKEYLRASTNKINGFSQNECNNQPKRIQQVCYPLQISSIIKTSSSKHRPSREKDFLGEEDRALPHHQPSTGKAHPPTHRLNQARTPNLVLMYQWPWYVRTATLSWWPLQIAPSSSCNTGQGGNYFLQAGSRQRSWKVKKKAGGW